MTFRADPAVIHASAARGDRWYPYAQAFPIPEADRQAKIVARLLVLHSMAAPAMTSLDSIRRYYERDDIHTESTFGLAMTGQMAQFVPINVRADCQYKANGFAASVETQDRGAGTLASTPWSPEQVEQLAGLAAWMHLNPRCALPLEDPPDWDAAGIGYHSEYDEWSIYVGKTCPGAARIAQMPAVRQRAREIAAWTPSPASGLELTAMYQIALQMPAGKLVCRVTASQIIHETNGVAEQVDREAGVRQVEVDRDEFLAMLAGGRATVGNPFTGAWADTELAKAWKARSAR